jgi:hypothetical protein
LKLGDSGHYIVGAGPQTVLSGANVPINQSFFHSPTDAQVNCLKNDFKIYIKIDIKTAPTCFGAVTPSSGSTLICAC